MLGQFQLSRPIQKYQQVISLPGLQLIDNNFVPSGQKYSAKYVYGWGLRGDESTKPVRMETSTAPENKCRTVDAYLDSQKFICTSKHKFDMCKVI